LSLASVLPKSLKILEANQLQVFLNKISWSKIFKAFSANPFMMSVVMMSVVVMSVVVWLLLETVKSEMNRLNQENISYLKSELSNTEQQVVNKLRNDLSEELRKWCEKAQSQLANQPQQPGGGDNDNHKLIVVSLSANLKEKENIIRDSFFEVFSDLKKRKSETPFNLLTLQTGRQLYTLLTDQELQSLPIEGEDSLLSRIEMTMNFGARDLKALADLSLVDNILQEQPSIGRILYLTDNTRMNDNPRKIPSQQRGVPLVWQKDGIALTVLTTKECKVWKYVGAKCTSWQDKTDLKHQLNAFLHQ